MIKTILIANRGEISLRVIKTCKKMGIKTVSVYARNDSSLPHASAADINICLGTGALSETYLNQEKLIGIAKDNNVDAIHPGYGFLSENTEFCGKVAGAGLIFIGPTTAAIELMGDKKTSKVEMEKLGIPLIPGYHGDNQDTEALLAEAVKIGFPVLIKATAGGGGKGMRIVESKEDFNDALESSQREAKNAFSNDKVLLEKYIINPRHIEVQLVSDGAGNHFHFFERECSIQRRYQKVIEEAPASCLTPELRDSFCKTAVQIAKGIDYVGAGTIEFILGPDNSYYFLEMNTRLQVEHPVTELITGVDLVELQIKAAQGEKFDFTQDAIKSYGHAIECRYYAENPDEDFFPTSGKIQKIEANNHGDYRLDCGYTAGNMISTQYDPMLAKLIVWDEDRNSAIEQMQDALDDVVFGGVQTNRDYLKRILSHPKFIDGDIHTHFIKEEELGLEKAGFSTRDKLVLAAGALIRNTKPAKNLWDSNFRPLVKTLEFSGEKAQIQIEKLNRNLVEISHGGLKLKFSTLAFDNNHIVLECEGLIFRYSVFTFNSKGIMHILVNSLEGQVYLEPKAKRSSASESISEGALQSPMPGKIFKILKKSGEAVSKGDTVLIVEAMKMEHSIRATRDGKITEVFFGEGDQVQGGVALCEIE